MIGIVDVTSYFSDNWQWGSSNKVNEHYIRAGFLIRNRKLNIHAQRQQDLEENKGIFTLLQAARY